jgi:hypothetical protein
MTLRQRRNQAYPVGKDATAEETQSSTVHEAVRILSLDLTLVVWSREGMFLRAAIWYLRWLVESPNLSIRVAESSVGQY